VRPLNSNLHDVIDVSVGVKGIEVNPITVLLEKASEANHPVLHGKGSLISHSPVVRQNNLKKRRGKVVRMHTCVVERQNNLKKRRGKVVRMHTCERIVVVVVVVEVVVVVGVCGVGVFFCGCGWGANTRTHTHTHDMALMLKLTAPLAAFATVSVDMLRTVSWKKSGIPSNLKG
jgi:hypothetical protein